MFVVVVDDGIQPALFAGTGHFLDRPVGENSVSSLGDSTFLDHCGLVLQLPFVGLQCVSLSGCSHLSLSS